jgi:hypothetical protein
VNIFQTYSILPVALYHNIQAQAAMTIANVMNVNIAFTCISVI